MVGKGILQEAKGRLLLRRMKMRDVGGRCEESWLGKAHDKDMYVWVRRVALSYGVLSRSKLQCVHLFKDPSSGHFSAT